MNLKRSISLMILAGVLAASLASCAVSSDDPESTKGSSENPQYTYTNDGGNTPVTPTVDPEDVVYTPVNETVYVISENASSFDAVAFANASLHRLVLASSDRRIASKARCSAALGSRSTPHRSARPPQSIGLL